MTKSRLGQNMSPHFEKNIFFPDAGWSEVWKRVWSSPPVKILSILCHFSVSLFLFILLSLSISIYLSIYHLSISLYLSIYLFYHISLSKFNPLYVIFSHVYSKCLSSSFSLSKWFFLYLSLFMWHFWRKNVGQNLKNLESDRKKPSQHTLAIIYLLFSLVKEGL